MHNYFLYKPWIVWALTESAKIPAKWRIASGSGETGWSCSEFGFRLCVDSRICRAKATRLFGSRQSRSDNIWPDSEMARIGFLSEVDFWSRPRQVCKMVRSATCVNKKYNFFLKKLSGLFYTSILLMVSCVTAVNIYHWGSITVCLWSIF